MKARWTMLAGVVVVGAGIALVGPRAVPLLAQVRGHLPQGRVTLAADSVVVPMGSWQGRSLVDLSIGGRGPFPFVLDTGAHGSILTRALADSLALPVIGEANIGSPAGGTPVKGRIVQVERGTLAGGAVALAFTSVAGEFARIPGPSPYWGALAPRDFGGLTITWDFPAHRFVFRRGALPEPDGREVFSYAGEPFPSVPITLGGRTLTAHLDTGSAAGLSLPEGMRDEVKLVAPPVPGRTAHTVDKDFPLMSATLAEPVGLGGRVLDSLAIELSPIERSPMMGCGLLKDYVVTLDPEHERIRLHRR